MDAEELAEDRADMEAEFRSVAIRKRHTTIIDDGGGEIEIPEPDVSFPCRVHQWRNPREDDTTGQIEVVATWQASLPWDADINEEDELEIDGGLFQIIDNNMEQTDKLTLKLELREVK